MTSKTDTDEKRDEEAFNALLGKMMNTPPKPHNQMKQEGAKRTPGKPDARPSTTRSRT